MNTCIIEMGSNIDPEANFEKALSFLKSDMHVEAVSNFITTKPLGIKEQDDFLNGAVKITTELNKKELNAYFKDIEDRLKRDRSLPKYGPRTIDLDIIVWNGTIIDND
ncbi:MAG TPA: 2-amino-4-hydroxy-6-hydroxymethyldihydropteridine diphosphokinase, partial [Prolixibacteraceae bacterium]|nr:2-amino-4-hydroxy-6-hydroxymethyldihydropteridine diphosphokinase [Prolixibacteraceae bacterium]